METKMIIEFINNKMVIKHPSGHVDEYDKEHLMKIKEHLVRRHGEMEQQINSIDENIAKL